MRNARVMLIRAELYNSRIAEKRLALPQASAAMSASALSQRLAAFRQNFKQILGPKKQVA